MDNTKTVRILSHWLKKAKKGEFQIKQFDLYRETMTLGGTKAGLRVEAGTGNIEITLQVYDENANNIDEQARKVE